MENLVYFMWLICSILYPSPDVPYLPADEMHCAPMSDMMCCEFTYTLGRYCCAVDDAVCEDDCTKAERVGDERNALRSTELWCLEGACSWSLEGYGYH